MTANEATPTDSRVPLRKADFRTLTEALDYAAQGLSGFNFYTGRGQLQAVLPYAQLRLRALDLATRLNRFALPRGARVALLAETRPEFPCLFFACQYAGLVPVPLPASIHMGGQEAYVGQLAALLRNSRATIAIASDELLPYLSAAAANLEISFLGTPEALADLPPGLSPLPLAPLQPAETAYLQYTSGSTRFPRGVMVSGEAVLSNLAGIVRHGLRIRPGDRGFSWLPLYHDMGMVGFLLAPLASQISVDFLPTRDFTLRPRQWLSLMSRNRSTISFSPPFGYELCLRRFDPAACRQLDLRRWRVAGVGAETIRPEVLERFAAAMAPAGFDPRAFVASYGMAECSLAVSFAPLDTGLLVDRVDAESLAEEQRAIPAGEDHGRCNRFVVCGPPLPGHQVEIRDARGRLVPERHCGTLFVRGPSVMSGYFNDPEETARVLNARGWLDTGDIGYRRGDRLVITGRQKDLIIIHGRNIWPQDLEHLAEQQPGVRPGDASAISVPSEDGEETAVLVIQCRESAEDKRRELVQRLRRQIQAEIGIDCLLELVPPHTLPRTSSGKLSRDGTRRDFLRRRQQEESWAQATLSDPEQPQPAASDLSR